MYTPLFNIIIILYDIVVIKSRRLRWAGHSARMEKGRSAFKILVGKPTGKIPLGRPRRSGKTTLKWILRNGELV